MLHFIICMRTKSDAITNGTTRFAFFCQIFIYTVSSWFAIRKLGSFENHVNMWFKSFGINIHSFTSPFGFVARSVERSLMGCILWRFRFKEIEIIRQILMAFLKLNDTFRGKKDSSHKNKILYEKITLNRDYTQFTRFTSQVYAFETLSRNTSAYLVQI